MKGWLSIVGLMVLSGCAAAPIYDHPTASSSEKRRDVVECSALAAQAAQGSGGYFSDRAIRTAVFENIRDQYLVTCLQGRGWKQRLGPAPEALPADYSPMRRCLQQALYLLDRYNGPHDGSNWPAWEAAQQRYIASHGMPTDRPPPDEQFIALLDRDLAARHASMNWSACVEARQAK